MYLCYVNQLNLITVNNKHCSIIKCILNSFLMFKVGLCLPGTEGCHSGPFGAMNTGPFWAGPDIPLGRRPFLGQMLASNKKNKNQLGRLLDSWPDSSPTFPSHLAAVEAGLHFLNSNSTHPFGKSMHKFTSIIIIIMMMIIYTLFSPFCVIQKRNLLWIGRLIKLQDIHIKLHYNTYTHFYTYI